jgi:hypothetical protein
MLVELLQMSVIDVIRLDCKNDSANRVSAIETVNWYCMLNPTTRLGISGAFLSFCTPRRVPLNMNLLPP